MKLRVRRDTTTRVVVIDSENDAPTLSSLQNAVRQSFQIEGEIQISLNGHDHLEGDDVKLSEHGIVSGDLILVLNPAQENQPEQTSNRPHLLQDIPSDNTDYNAMSASQNQYDYNHGTTDMSQYSSEGGPMDYDGAAYQNFPEHFMYTDGNLTDSNGVRDSEVNKYLNEPMLVRESTENDLPQTLQQAYLNAEVQNKNDSLCVVLHILMTESGFCLQDENEETNAGATASPINTSSVDLPQNWKRPGVYSFHYRHPNYVDVKFKLNCVPLGSIMIIHGTEQLEGAEVQKAELKLNPSEYVRKIDEGSVSSKSFTRLSKLSGIFKDTIVYPLLEYASQDCDLPNTNTLVGLFPEIKLLIFKYLDLKTLLDLSQTCRELKSLCRDRTTWRRMYLLHFGSREDNNMSQDWKEMYKEQYVTRSKIRRAAHVQMIRPMMNPFWLDRFHPPFPNPPTYPPGFVGGGYDRDPDFPNLPGLGPDPNPTPFHPMFFAPPLPRPRFLPPGYHQDNGFGGRGATSYRGIGRRGPYPGGGGFRFF